MALHAWPLIPAMNIPLFDNGLVYLCRDFEDWKVVHAAAGLTAEEDHRLSSGGCRNIYHRNKRRFVVCVNSGKASTLANICSEICSMVGMPCRESEGYERFCYLLGSLMDYFLPYIKNRLCESRFKKSR